MLSGSLEGKVHEDRGFVLFTKEPPGSGKKIGAHYLFVERTNKKNKKWQKMNENNAKSGLLKEPVGKKLISQD